VVLRRDALYEPNTVRRRPLTNALGVYRHLTEETQVKGFSVFAYALLCLPTTVFADQFVAVCDADGVHAYRNSTNISAEPMGAEWKSGERFSGKWRFAFDGKKIQVDGKEAVLISWNGNVLTAISAVVLEDAASIWSYAINLDLEEIVGAQVNAYRTIGTGIKTRAVNFKCRFDYDA